MTTETENGLQQETEGTGTTATETEQVTEGTESGAEATGEGQEGTETETVAEGAEQTEKPKPATRKEDWRDRRFKQENAKRHEAERELARLRAELEAARGGAQSEQTTTEAKPITQADIEREAERIVNERAQRQQITKAIQAGEAEFGKQEFTDACNLLADMGANEKPEFLHAITDEDNGHKIIQHFGQNPEEAERIMSLPPLKMAKEIAKLSLEIDKPKAPPVSKAPTPIKPIDGRARTEATPDKMSDEDFDKWYGDRLAAHRNR